MNEFEKRLGIIQGRLLPPIDGLIQEFPIDNWKKEFQYIDNLKISFIEWIITKKSFDHFLNLDLIEYSSKISSVCCDHLIDNRINDQNFVYQYLSPICDFCISNNIKNITIPLLEESNLNQNNFENLKLTFKNLANFYNKLDFNFEIDAHFSLVNNFMMSHKNFYFTYDTGNLTSSGFDHFEFIESVFRFIRNIHLKDRTINPIKTVEPLFGKTNFFVIFEKLRHLNYNGNFIIQTARREDGLELQTISEHKKIFEKIFYEKYI